MVRYALTNPEWTDTGYEGRLLAYKSFDDRRIKVVYVKEDDNPVIVTVIWD